MYTPPKQQQQQKELTQTSHILVRAGNLVGAALLGIGGNYQVAITDHAEGSVVHSGVIGTAEETIGYGCGVA
jgi:hypothetical protein